MLALPPDAGWERSMLQLRGLYRTAGIVLCRDRVF